MEDIRNCQPDPPLTPRRFVYRSVEPDEGRSHPLRRATDTPRPFLGMAGQLSPSAMFLKFRVYLKVN